MAIKCPKCNSDNTETARFCSNCATSLGAPRDHGPFLTKTLQSPISIVTPGTIIAGHYEVLEKLGQGGMGEVYRALDKSLGRHVAIKILPAGFSADPERLARFEREAKLLASLNHPNIAAVHGFEESMGLRFLALELIEGETLQTRLDRGALPMDEALETCRQVAEGLEAAHERGVVHRDLKPGNIMITPEGKAKILDFGLAKAFVGDTTGIDIANSPTITAQMTEPGVILGTAAYMSPEQARGRTVDKRADIWAFGCVFYECLAAGRAFQGDTVSDTLAHVLKSEPDWDKLPAQTPALIKVLIRRCLEKDPRKRLRDIGDARLEIEAPIAYPSEGAAASRKFALPWLAAGSVGILFAGILIGRVLIKRSQRGPPAPVVTSTIKIEPGHWLDGSRRMDACPSRTALAISSDGRFVIYSAIEENPGLETKPQLYLRRLDRPEAEPIAGTEGGINPFLSPDNRWVGFWADQKLKKTPIEGGVATLLCDARPVFGANWGRDGILFADRELGGISRIPDAGGPPEVLTEPDHKREETSHRLPLWLPGGKAVLFTAMRYSMDQQPSLALLRLDTREWRALLQDAADAKYVPTGHLVFLRRGTLMAVRFDLAKLEIVGQPVPLIGNVLQAFDVSSFTHTSAGQFGISDTGSLIYAGGSNFPNLKSSVVWVDKRGSEQPITELQSDSHSLFFSPRLSPDGKKIAYVTLGQENQLWVYELDRGVKNRLTNEGWASFPVWAPDSSRLVFRWLMSRVGNLYWQRYDGGSPMERLTTSDSIQTPGSWSRDGKTVAFVEARQGNHILVLDVGTGKTTPFSNAQFTEWYPEFSPDGRWMAYTSNESKTTEVYVRAFPGPGMKQRVSNEGGREPIWARNGKQIFYRRQNQVWVVDVRTEGVFELGKPRLLFDKPGILPGAPIRCYDLSFDSQKFLMVKSELTKSTPVSELILVQNWFEELKRLVPTGEK